MGDKCFFFKSRCEVEEKLRSENFAATKTIGFDNAEKHSNDHDADFFFFVLICELSFWDDPCSLEKTRETIK